MQAGSHSSFLIPFSLLIAYPFRRMAVKLESSSDSPAQTRPDGERSDAIEVLGVTKIFPARFPRVKRLLHFKTKPEVVALREVTLSVRAGEIFGLIGRNGAGKTTLLKIISALILPTSGTVRVVGYDVQRESERARAAIGLVTADERSFYWRLTGQQNLMFFARLYGMSDRAARRRIEYLLELLDLQELAPRRFHEYSTGNRQRLAVVRALLTDPPVLLLDEPTRSLDPIVARELRALIRERVSREAGKTVLLTTHNLAEIEELSDRVAVIKQGVIQACGTPAEMIAAYGGRQQVRLQARFNDEAMPTDEAALRALLPAAEDLGARRLADGAFELSFTRTINDELLDQALAGLQCRGAKILACHTSQGSLHDVLESFELREDEG
jgi:ABC-2 type transport system ATP-binding protein